MPAHDRLDGLVHGHEERVDRAVALSHGLDRLAVHEQGDRALGRAALARADGPVHQLHQRVGRILLGPGGQGLDEGREVRVGDFLLGVGECDGLLVHDLECFAFEVIAELGELALQAAAAAELAHRQARARKAHRLRGHDLVGERVLEHAVLVDARLVREGVAADDGLVGLDAEAGQVADQPAGVAELLGVDAVARDRELGRAGAQGHHHLFERGVAGTFAEAVDGDLHLAGAGLHRGQGVGRGQTQVVVAVDADDGAGADTIDDLLRELAELCGDGIADGIGDVHGGGAGIDHGLVDLEQEVMLGAAGVLGAELDLCVGTQALARVADPLDRGLQGLLSRHLQLVLEMDVAGGDEEVQVRLLRR